MVIDGRLVVVESAERDFVDFLLDGWNPHHRGVTVLHRPQIVASRVVKVEHARQRGLDETSASAELMVPIARIQPKTIRLPGVECRHKLAVAPHRVVVVACRDLHPVAGGH